MSDEETLKVYDAQAAKYAEFTGAAFDNGDMAAFTSALPRGGAVLDLGCGPGLMSAHMARLGFTVTATDASPEMIKLASAHPGVTARVETFEQMHSDGAYDGIFANFSLLHAVREDVPGHVRALVAMLKPGGIFHIAMKTGTGQKRDTIGRRYAYFTEAELEAMLTQNGLSVLYRNAGEDLGLDGVMAKWVCLQARRPGAENA